MNPAQFGILANWFLVINFTQPANVQKARKNGSNAKIANMVKAWKIIRVATVHFKTKPDTNSLRKSPTRNNVLNYSASTTVGYFKQTPHKQLMHIFFFALLQFCMVPVAAWSAAT